MKFRDEVRPSYCHDALVRGPRSHDLDVALGAVGNNSRCGKRERPTRMQILARVYQGGAGGGKRHPKKTPASAGGVDPESVQGPPRGEVRAPLQRRGEMGQQRPPQDDRDRSCRDNISRKEGPIAMVNTGSCLPSVSNRLLEPFA